MRVNEPPGRRWTLTVFITLLMTAFPLLPRWGVWMAAIVLVVATLVAWRRRDAPAAHLGVFGSVLVLIALAGSPYSQLSFGFAIVVYLGVVRSVAFFRGELRWLRVGRLGWDVALLGLGSAGLAGAALLLWFFLVRPDVGDLFDRFVPDVSRPLLIVGGLLFALVNAAVEEVAYRGIMLDALRATLPAASAVALQAVAFGSIHLEGFPRGWIGIGLATVYGVMMGVIRLRASGMLAPWICHVFTDLTIVGILLLAA